MTDKLIHFPTSPCAVLGVARLPAVDAYCFCNPFEENATLSSLDADADLGQQRHERELEAVRGLLAAARSGTYVLTCNGLGGRLPAVYQLVRIDHELPNVLRSWRKAVPRIVATGAIVASSGPTG